MSQEHKSDSKNRKPNKTQVIPRLVLDKNDNKEDDSKKNTIKALSRRRTKRFRDILKNTTPSHTTQKIDNVSQALLGDIIRKKEQASEESPVANQAVVGSEDIVNNNEVQHDSEKVQVEKVQVISQDILPEVSKNQDREIVDASDENEYAENSQDTFAIDRSLEDVLDTSTDEAQEFLQKTVVIERAADKIREHKENLSLTESVNNLDNKEIDEVLEATFKIPEDIQVQPAKTFVIADKEESTKTYVIPQGDKTFKIPDLKKIQDELTRSVEISEDNWHKMSQGEKLDSVAIPKPDWVEDSLENLDKTLEILPNDPRLRKLPQKNISMQDAIAAAKNSDFQENDTDVIARDGRAIFSVDINDGEIAPESEEDYEVFSGHHIPKTQRGTLSNLLKLTSTEKQKFQFPQTPKLDLEKQVPQTTAPAAKFPQMDVNVLRQKKSHTEHVMGRIRKFLQQSGQNETLQRRETAAKEAEKLKEQQTFEKISGKVKKTAVKPLMQGKYAYVKARHYSIHLNEDMARVWEAMRLGIITKEQVIEVLLNLCRVKSARSLWANIYVRGYIEDYQYEMLQRIKSKKVVTKIKPYEIGKPELSLAKKIVEFNILPRKEVQNVLRILNHINTLGVGYSLDALLIDSKLLSKEITHALIDQVALEASFLRRASSRKKRQTTHFSYLRVAVVLGCLLSVTLVVTWYMTARPRKRNFADTPHQVQTPKVSKKRVYEEPAPQKNIAHTVKWGKFVLQQEHAAALAQYYTVGSSLDPPIFLDNLSVTYHDDFLLRGNLNFPKMPDFFAVNLSVTLKSADGYVYGTALIACKYGETFTSRIKLKKQLIPGYYELHTYIDPQLHSDFMVYFLNLKQLRRWTFHIQAGSYAQIKNIEVKNQKKLLTTIKRIYSLYKMWIKSKKKPQKEMMKLARMMKKWRNTPHFAAKKCYDLFTQLQKFEVLSEKERLAFQLKVLNTKKDIQRFFAKKQRKKSKKHTISIEIGEN